MSAAVGTPFIKRLRLSPILSAYLARQYGLWFSAYFVALVGVTLLVSTVDLLDRLASKKVPLVVAFEMALLKLPFVSQEVMPFTVLFAGITCLWRLTRSHELVVARATGVSIWQILTPVVAVALVVGVMAVALLNPVATALLGKYGQFEAQYIRNQSSALAVSSGGLWLRQADKNGQSVIHAETVSQDSMALHKVIVFRFNEQDRFVGRIDARRAELRPGRWVFFDAWRSNPAVESEFVPEMDLATELTRKKILESFAAPRTISFWTLPGFIALLEKAGFSALRHKMQLHRLLATPFLFAAMILLAAACSLRPHRRGGIGLIILVGVLIGFLLYFLSSFVFALGLSAKIPFVLAAWAPAGISLFLGVAVLLHLEDG